MEIRVKYGGPRLSVRHKRQSLKYGSPRLGDSPGANILQDLSDTATEARAQSEALESAGGKDVDYNPECDMAVRVKAVEALAAGLEAGMDAENLLWDCVIAFQKYLFHTASGLPFTYTLKIGQKGTYTKELFVDRRKNSKSLSWGLVRTAFVRALETPGKVYKRPKEIADVRGISYSYSLLWRFGVIAVPEAVEQKLQGR